MDEKRKDGLTTKIMIRRRLGRHVALTTLTVVTIVSYATMSQETVKHDVLSNVLYVEASPRHSCTKNQSNNAHVSITSQQVGIAHATVDAHQ
jgi:hypothetical protein